ncbi:MAG: hypothetical protein QGG58_01625 [Chloroflexota bacterium]|jgi:hypothetical protein|nr:hypothetical protein [Chloroflexota bacterium]
MSAAASIALLILAVEVMLMVVGLLILLVITGIAIVEATALTRRGIRKQAKAVDRANQAAQERIERHVLKPVARFERGYAWTAAFLRSLNSDDSDSAP